jgi:hypothetical protein
MTRAILSIASAVLVLTSVVSGTNVTKVDAKADAQIHLYPFNSESCYGPPTGSPLELKQGECVNFHGARSVKPMLRPDHTDWIGEVNELRTHCKLETFRAPGCPASDENTQYLHHSGAEMPKNLHRCLTATDAATDDSDNDDTYPLYSARFVCGKVENPELLCTSTIEHTSWSMDAMGKPTQSVRTATYTGTLAAGGHKVRSVSVEKPEPTLHNKGFKPGRETKGVWMLHPWSRTVVCYTCYPKKEHDYSKVECRHGIQYTAQCGGRPVGSDGEPSTPRVTTTATTTATTTTHTTSTSLTIRDDTFGTIHGVYTDADTETDSSDVDLSDWQTQRRSWHKPVKFNHPFIDGQYLCADAEWEKRGRPESYIKVQHCHICDHNDRKDSEWIGLPETVTSVVSRTTTTTNTIEHTHVLSIGQAHDQL